MQDKESITSNCEPEPWRSLRKDFVTPYRDKTQLVWGQTALPVILLISTIVIEVAIAGAFIAFFASTSGQGERLSARALAAAQAGIRDAFIKIARDKNFSPSPNPYNLTVGDDTVTIEVSKNVTNDNFTVTSTAVAASRQVRLVGILSIDDTTGKIELRSVEEKPIP